ncbi:MAG: protein-disulfide reductase DsbD family protein [Bacteroidetes bacterium]|nr:protein-disulfide reductase DsbD family protein [Bacteroidota bacterium]
MNRAGTRYRMGVRAWSAASLFCMGLLPTLWAQSRPGFTSPVQWSLRLEPAQAQPGQALQAIATARVSAPWHLYSTQLPPGGPVPTSFTVEGGGLEPAGPVEEPPPKRVYDPNFKMEVGWHTGTVAFRIPLRVRADLKAGVYTLRVRVRYMVCSDRQCLPPTTETLEAPLAVRPVQKEPVLDARTLAGTQVTAPIAEEEAQPLYGSLAKVRWSAQLESDSVLPGQEVRLRLRATIEPGWRLYAASSPRGAGLPLEITLPASYALLGTWQEQGAVEAYDSNFQARVRLFSDRAELWGRVRIPNDLTAGEQTLTLGLRFMVCNDRMCLPPAQTTVPVVFRVVPPLKQVVSAGASVASPQIVPDGPLGAGFWAFLWLAVLAGLAALLTPCVFPMIPLTVSFFSKQSGGHRSRSVAMALHYGLAIVATFTGLGVLMALLLGAAGAARVAANPWVNLFIGLVFVAFGLSLLGLYEFRVPVRLLNAVNRLGSKRTDWIGIWFMGLTLTLVSFSCTVPFVGALLAATALGQWFWPILGMLAFSATFAAPFVLFALFPHALQRLPRSGQWMNTLKVVLGFVELAAAIKFLSNADLVWGWGLISRPLAIALWIALFAVTGLYLLGKIRLPQEEPLAHVGPLRLLFGVGAIAFSLYLIPGLLGAPLGRLDAWLPPRQGTDVGLLAASSPAGSSGQRTNLDPFEWHHEPESAIAEARRTGKPIFIDFTGYTCTNCRDMEANVFPKAPVAERMGRDFVLLRLYTDEVTRGPEWQRLQFELTGTVALPTYVVMTADRRVLAVHSGMASVEEFVAFLDRGLNLARQLSEGGRSDNGGIARVE